MKIPTIVSYPDLVISFLLLFTGFIFMGVTWGVVIRRPGGLPVSLIDSICSQGLSTFGKYVPGKIWSLVGRAAFLAQKENLRFETLSVLSLTEQLVSLWVGLILGSIGIFFIDGLEIWGAATALLFIGLTFATFTVYPNQIMGAVLTKMLNRPFALIPTSFSNLIPSMPYFFITWSSLCLGFYFLVRSLTVYPIDFSIGFGFALATTFGVLAVFAPAGLGVREGVLIGYLSLAGLDMHDATTVSITSRIWFLIGECFMVCVGLVLKLASR